MNGFKKEGKKKKKNQGDVGEGNQIKGAVKERIRATRGGERDGAEDTFE